MDHDQSSGLWLELSEDVLVIELKLSITMIGQRRTRTAHFQRQKNVGRKGGLVRWTAQAYRSWDGETKIQEEQLQYWDLN